ncbi:hypothetical protein D3C72_338450 [compost metagenome]
MSPTSLLMLGSAIASMLVALLLFFLQLDNRMSWDLWWIPYVLAFAAPVGLVAAYIVAGVPWRGVWVGVAAWVILFGLGALGVSAAAVTDRAGEVLAVIVAAATGLTLLVAAWAGWDLQRRAALPPSTPPVETGV